jgi:hypothetical protein
VIAALALVWAVTSPALAHDAGRDERLAKIGPG